MVPREDLTEHRLGALESKVDEGFKRVDKRFDEGFARVDERFKQVDDRFDRFEKSVDERFNRLEDRFDRLADGFYALNRTLVVGAVAIVAALIGSSAF